MASVLAQAQTATELEAEKGILGPTAAGALNKVAPPTTVMAFYRYFSKTASKIKNFFTHTIPSLFQKPHTPMKIIGLSILFFIIFGIGYFFYNFIMSQKEGFQNVSTTLSTNVIQRNNFVVNNILSSILAKPEGFQNTSNKSNKNPMNNNTKTDPVKLFNIQPLTFKQAAFLGPTIRGYFDAKHGIFNQLKTGCRSFFLQIDYLEVLKGTGFTQVNEPCLLYRDKVGNLTSSNSLKLSDVCNAINEFGFNDLIPNNKTPIVLYLHFVRLPYAPTDTDNYISYLSKVATALNGLTSILTGGYYRASKEKDLFSNDFPSFGQSVIIGTNIDTSVFNRVKVDQSADLDYATHFHYNVIDSEVVDVTSIALHNYTPNAVIFNSGTVLASTPTAWAMYKNYFIIVKVSNDTNLTPSQMSSLLNDYGVNVILYDYFDENIANSKTVLNYYTSPYSMKPLVLQS